MLFSYLKHGAAGVVCDEQQVGKGGDALRGRRVPLETVFRRTAVTAAANGNGIVCSLGNALPL